MSKNTVILTHSGADLDAISSMFAAGKLYPGSFLIHPGSLDTSTEKMVNLFDETLKLVKVRELPRNIRENIGRIIVVDTKIKERIGNGKEFLNKKNVEVIVFDHHPETSRDIKNAKIIQRNYGANTTILTELLMKKKIALTPTEATILALGIYEDTGSFMFPLVTHNDFSAMAFLSLFGINMKIIRHFVSPFLSNKQIALLEKFISNMEELDINGIKTVITYGETKQYTPGISVITHRLREMIDSDMLFVINKTNRGTFVVGRSNSPEYSVKNILLGIGGGGHTTAATAYLEESDTKKIKAMLISLIKKANLPKLRAENIMNFPIKTIDAKTGIKQAFKIMAKLGFSGLPVTENGKIIGIISKRDIEKIMLVEKRDRPVKQFLTPKVVKVNFDADMRKIEEAMVKNNVGRVLVQKGNRIVGIISRSDLLKAFYTIHSAEKFVSALTPSRDEIKILLKNRFPSDIYKIIEILSKTAEKTKQKIYFVGGGVRDLLLGEKCEDLDFTLEKDAILFVKTLLKEVNFDIKIDKEFGTAHARFKNYTLDFATTRREYYGKNSLLPKVEFASLMDDLKRRDFTINAMAISLNKEDFGQLYDFFNGIEDLKNRQIRVIHNLSFIEDPSRLLRAIKYESKLNFKLSEETEKLFLNAVKLHVLKMKKSQRIIGELTELLSAEYAPRAILNMAKRGVLYEFFGIKKLSKKRRNAILSAEKWIKEFDAKRLYVYLFLLLHNKKAKEISGTLQYLSVKKKIIQNMIEAERTFKKIKRKNDDVSLYFTLKNIFDPFIIGYIAYTDKNMQEKLLKYMINIRNIKPLISGKDLKSLGIKEGKEYGKIFEEITVLKIKGSLKNMEEEINYVMKRGSKNGR